MGLSDIIDEAKSNINEYERNKRIDIEKPRTDQKRFTGRFQHFWNVANPLNLFHTDAQLEYAKNIVQRYRLGENIPNLTEDELWKQKHLYDSAFHPETGEKTFILGRMSAQVPCNMVLGGGMLHFYKSLPAVLAWQWLNQSFNAIVNYCNRSGAQNISDSELVTNYFQATGGSMAIALGLTKLASKAPLLIARLMPFTTVVAANATNIPLVRRKEIQNGIKVMDKNEQTLGTSRLVAMLAITQVVISRAFMAAPSMATIPIIMSRLEKSGFLQRNPRFPFPFQVFACGAILIVANPFCCAFFPQTASVPTSWLEQEVQDKLNKMPDPPKEVYYHKGL